jgi:hypothetical protein
MPKRNSFSRVDSKQTPGRNFSMQNCASFAHHSALASRAQNAGGVCLHCLTENREKYTA